MSGRQEFSYHAVHNQSDSLKKVKKSKSTFSYIQRISMQCLKKEKKNLVISNNNSKYGQIQFIFY